MPTKQPLNISGGRAGLHASTAEHLRGAIVYLIARAPSSKRSRHGFIKPGIELGSSLIYAYSSYVSCNDCYHSEVGVTFALTYVIYLSAYRPHPGRMITWRSKAQLRRHTPYRDINPGAAARKRRRYNLVDRCQTVQRIEHSITAKNLIDCSNMSTDNVASEPAVLRQPQPPLPLLQRLSRGAVVYALKGLIAPMLWYTEWKSSSSPDRPTLTKTYECRPSLPIRCVHCVPSRLLSDNKKHSNYYIASWNERPFAHPNLQLLPTHVRTH